MTLEAQPRTVGDVPLTPLLGGDREAGPKHRVGFICAGDPEDARTWSGTPLHMLTHLRDEFDVAVVVRHPWAWWLILARRVMLRLSGGSIDLFWSPFWARLGSRRARRQLAGSDLDLVFCIGITPLCAILSKTMPTVFVSDATAAGLVDYNPRRSAMSTEYRKRAMRLETEAVSRSVAAFYPSTWARDDAIRHHGADPSRVHYVHWGANLVGTRGKWRDVDHPTPWRLIFVGTSWQGKGGTIAVECVRRLGAMGMDVHLDIVGSRPDADLPDANITLHDFLDKNVAVDRKKLVELFSRSHLLLFPTQFEALGIVSAEAASFGVPTIAFHTGGVAGNIIDGETGILLAPGTLAQQWAETVSRLLRDRPRYDAMCEAALAWSVGSVNWSVWAETVKTVLYPANAISLAGETGAQ